MTPIRLLRGALLGAALLVAGRAGAQPVSKDAPARGASTAAPVGKAEYRKEFGTMWTFDAPPLAYWKERYGFAPDQAWLDHVRLAAVRLPGCSASFVSPKGLVMTNHHCARECVVSASPPDTNYLKTGFAARSMAEEKKCSGLYVDQLQSVEDVTARVRGAATARTAGEQVAQRTRAIAAVEQECRARTNLTCQVVSLYQGGRYSLYTYRRFTDVRFVMAPEEDIAFFGGDPDNFTYPRYDLDMSWLRVYDNGQPYQPKDYLKWSAAGAREGEPVFVVGNPGSTGRLLTLAQMEYLRDVQYPFQLAQYRRLIAAYRAAQPGASEEKQREYANAIFGLENSLKAVTGYRSGLTDSAIMARKRDFERDFRARVTADPALRAKYGRAWDDIARAQAELASLARYTRWVGFGGGSTLWNYAGGLVRLPSQAALADSLRLPQYRGAAIENVRRTIGSQARPDTTFEIRALAATFAAARDELGADDPYIRAALSGRTPEEAARALVRGTTLGDPAARQALLAGGAAAVRASNDPLVALARQVEARSTQYATRAARLDATIAQNAGLVGEAQYAAYGTALPPDATFTLRISDGVVKGYPANGTMQPYKTTFNGLYERAEQFDNKEPFQLPRRWTEREGRLDKDTPYDFVTTNDIIGGNSGSPMINAKGEVVGLIFDGNIESLPNRFIFTDEVARSVGVHSRGITEALRKMYDAGWIVDELEGRTAVTP